MEFPVFEDRQSKIIMYISVKLLIYIRYKKDESPYLRMTSFPAGADFSKGK